ncbi:TIGR03086 family metal-binding protein [Rhodococcus sp. HNM0569]|uniref:TIGR03086 family metal-binding protein n=1 Tax=Rhodococcus sp. HNM0569 TaxID=2716340 RepID=UPI00146A3CDB|nr:TIGR03086 family metal-binding protein [Rhodococcus sp. HNM0569]NLU83758.1 TIGR03086 family protein [Rhodococcus sp. HNM0569]
MGYDWVALQVGARDEFSRRVAAIGDWNAATPDTEWTVTDLVRHAIEEQQWVPPLLAGRTVADADADIAPLHGDMREEWQRYARAASDAWAATAPDATVHLSFGDFRADYYLRQQTSDLTIHAWDLARATGTDDTLDATLVQAVWEDLAPQRDMLAASGLFAAPVDVPESAPVQDRLVALTGRDPARRPAHQGRR